MLLYTRTWSYTLYPTHSGKKKKRWARLCPVLRTGVIKTSILCSWHENGNNNEIYIRRRDEYTSRHRRRQNARGVCTRTRIIIIIHNITHSTFSFIRYVIVSRTNIVQVPPHTCIEWTDDKYRSPLHFLLNYLRPLQRPRQLIRKHIHTPEDLINRLKCCSYIGVYIRR